MVLQQIYKTTTNFQEKPGVCRSFSLQRFFGNKTLLKSCWILLETTNAKRSPFRCLKSYKLESKQDILTAHEEKLRIPRKLNLFARTLCEIADLWLSAETLRSMFASKLWIKSGCTFFDLNCFTSQEKTNTSFTLARAGSEWEPLIYYRIFNATQPYPTWIILGRRHCLTNLTSVELNTMEKAVSASFSCWTTVCESVHCKPEYQLVNVTFLDCFM